jgi:uncharacterized protein YggE
MKHVQILINALLCAVLLLVLAAIGLPGAAAARALPAATASPTPAPACDTSRSIQVSGAATVNVVPDRALIKLGLQSNGLTARGVQTINAATIQKIIAAVGALGIPSKDIATDWYVINPVYEDYSSLYIKGYRINNYLAVTIRDVGKINDVIIAAMGAGANEVVNVDLYTSELRKYRDQARAMAVKAAKEKAQALAQGAGAQTGCVIHINENTWSSYNGWWYGRNQNMMTQNVVQNAAPAAGSEPAGVDEDGPLSLGQISVQATVDVTFGLK